MIRADIIHPEKAGLVMDYLSTSLGVTNIGEILEDYEYGRVGVEFAPDRRLRKFIDK